MPLADQITSFPPSLSNFKKTLEEISLSEWSSFNLPLPGPKKHTHTHTPTSLQIHLHLAAEKTQPPTHQTNPKKQCHFERPHGLPWSSSHDHTLGPPRAEIPEDPVIKLQRCRFHVLVPPQLLEAGKKSEQQHPVFHTKKKRKRCSWGWIPEATKTTRFFRFSKRGSDTNQTYINHQQMKQKKRPPLGHIINDLLIK